MVLQLNADQRIDDGWIGKRNREPVSLQLPETLSHSNIFVLFLFELTLEILKIESKEIYYNGLIRKYIY